MLLKALLVGLGGFAGAIARYGITQFSSEWIKNWPLGTLLVNLLGSFLLGALIYGAFNQKVLPDSYRLLLAVGFCGSLTTMSTFALDTVQLAETKELLSAIFYFILNALGCILMVLAARQLFG